MKVLRACYSTSEKNWKKENTCFKTDLPQERWKCNKTF